MSDKSMKLPPDALDTMHHLTRAYVRALEAIAGREIKVAMVLAPVTFDNEKTDGTTQVQIISNMEPALAKKVFADMSEIVELAGAQQGAGPGAFFVNGSDAALN